MKKRLTITLDDDETFCASVHVDEVCVASASGNLQLVSCTGQTHLISEILLPLYGQRWRRTLAEQEPGSLGAFDVVTIPGRGFGFYDRAGDLHAGFPTRPEAVAHASRLEAIPSPSLHHA